MTSKKQEMFLPGTLRSFYSDGLGMSILLVTTWYLVINNLSLYRQIVKQEIVFNCVPLALLQKQDKRGHEIAN